MVDMAEEVTGSNKGSNSEIQSLSSFQSDSCDDNGKTHISHFHHEWLRVLLYINIPRSIVFFSSFVGLFEKSETFHHQYLELNTFTNYNKSII